MTKRKAIKPRHAERLMINEIKRILPAATDSYLKRVALELNRLTQRSGQNSSDVKGNISKAIQVVNRKLKKARLEQNLRSLLLKKRRLESKARKTKIQLVSGNQQSNEKAKKVQVRSEQNWIERGGEKFVKPTEIRSNKIYPSNNELNNDSGDQESDDAGFAPMQQ